MDTANVAADDRGTDVTPLQNRTVLVTGGTGSMGQAFVRRALTGEFGTPRKVIVFSRDELKQSEMRRTHPGAQFILGDIRSYEDVLAAMSAVDVVVNAAALKQVPSCEYFPLQAIQTNCLGLQNIIRACHRFLVEKVVTISTDKACKPTTVMGMTKALQERLMVAANVDVPQTRFVGVRYGNVMNSRGSVIPLFREQVRAGGPLTITDSRMTRFLLTLEGAVNAMIAALTYARPGEIYVPASAPAASIFDIALCFANKRRIPCEVTRIRPGEKLHELVLSEEESRRAVFENDHFVLLPELPELESQDAPPTGAHNGDYSSRHGLLCRAELEKILQPYLQEIV